MGKPEQIIINWIIPDLVLMFINYDYECEGIRLDEYCWWLCSKCSAMFTKQDLLLERQ